MTRFAIDKRYVTFAALLVVAVAGIMAYRTMPQAEDPGFTIRTAVVQTYLPGASPERVEELITDSIEATLQQIPELDYSTSQSLTGVSVIYANFQEKYTDMRPIFDNLRRKVQDAARSLPEGTIGPFIDDEFGDTFGIIYTITGEGFSYAELKDVADQVRDELLRVPDAAKVEIYGAQDERIFLDYDTTRLAQLGLSPQQLKQLLAGQNTLLPGGSLIVGPEKIVLEPSGSFESIDELGKTVLVHPATGDVLYLEDVVDIRRGYVEPRKSFVESNGVQALGLGISMRDGGNVLNLGAGVEAVIDRVRMVYPIGIEFEQMYFQPEKVAADVDNFIVNLLEAVGIVVLLMLVFLGVRTGLVVATLLPMAILASLAVMQLMDISLNTISIAALIIALGLLVDNAIVVSEAVLVRMEAGEKARDAALGAAAELRVPLLTSSLTTIAAFLPIYLAESSTGEYTAHLFMVVGITLLASWLLSLTMIPLLCVIFIRAKKTPRDSGPEFDSRFYRSYRGALIGILRRPWVSLAVVVVLFLGAMQLGRFVPVQFFPKSDRPFLRATLEFPVGTPLDVTAAMMQELDAHLRDEHLVGPDREHGLVKWLDFVGMGTPRYTLSAQVDPPREELARLLMTFTDRPTAEAASREIEGWLWDRYPDLDAVILPLDYGPPVRAPVEVRVSSPDSDELFALTDRIADAVAGLPGTRNITDDWGPRVKKLLVDIDQPRARRAGISSLDVAVSLQAALGGMEVTEFRENEDVIPVMLRSHEAEHLDVSRLETMEVASQATGRSVPLKQVADLQVLWEPSQVLRRDRLRTVTVSAHLDPGHTAAATVAALEAILGAERADWPVGTFIEYGGEVESSQAANESIVAKLPIAFMFILLLLVIQFNNVREPAIILLTIPLAMIGVFIGLVILGGAMGFMTFLGVVSLAGIVINNAIVLLDRIRIEIEENGLTPQAAVIASAQQRLRPILLTTATTVAGLLPLYFGGGPMWRSMSIAIIFGLSFATLLTLGVVPILYSLFSRVGFKSFVYRKDES